VLRQAIAHSANPYQIRLLQYPDLAQMGGKQVTGAEELYDIDFNQDGTQVSVSSQLLRTQLILA